MIWSISEILKPFKKLAVVYYHVLKLEANPARSLNSTTQTLLILIADGAPGNPKGEK